MNRVKNKNNSHIINITIMTGKKQIKVILHNTMPSIYTQCMAARDLNSRQYL